MPLAWESQIQGQKATTNCCPRTCLGTFTTNTFANTISACVPINHSTNVSANAYSTYLDGF